MPRLDFYSDCKPFVKIKLRDRGFLIGRSGDCDVQLSDERVSRHHARVEPHYTGSYLIEDLSANGTRLNAAMLEERTRLKSGDRIYIEDFVAIFQPDDVPPETLTREETELDGSSSGLSG